MFNWNDQDQAGLLWPELTKSDHIVPHPMEAVEETLLYAGDHKRTKRDECFATDRRSTGQSFRSTNDHSRHESEGTSSFLTQEELSSSRAEMDWWFDFPNLCIDLKDEFTDGNAGNAMTELINDAAAATSLNPAGDNAIQLGQKPDLLGNEDKENNYFLDCDWSTFGDFDDIENLFRKNDSVFGHDMICDADGFLSPAKDVIDSTAQSIPLPDLPLCKGRTSDEGCSSFELDDNSSKQRSPSHKEKADAQKIIPRFQDQAEERRKNRSLKNLKDTINQTQDTQSANVDRSAMTSLQNFQSNSVSQQMQFGDAKLMEQQASSNHVAALQHGYTACYYPGMQSPSHLQTDVDQKRPVPTTYEVCSDDTKNMKASNRPPDGKPATMTPQAKMEKLRRLQQMQAQLAIEQQHQQYGHQIPGASVVIPQSFSQNNQTVDAMTSTITTDECMHKIPLSELKMEAEQDESKGTSGLTYETPVEETIYHQLQDVVGKLDMRIRLCIRDSLFRLARSAMERQSASDRSSTNTSNKDEDEISTEEEFANNDRSTTLGGLETDTNPIDRIVANLLFQRPTEATARLGASELVSSS